MFDDKTQKKPKFKMLNGHLIVHSKGEEKLNKIKVPNMESYQDHRQWIDKDNTVYAVAKDIDNQVNVGDKILLKEHCRLQAENRITKIIEEMTGTKTSQEILDKEGKKTGHTEELEKYFIIKLEDILCVINE